MFSKKWPDTETPGRPRVTMDEKETFMLHEVRVFSPKGNLKKVVSTKLLSKRHWRIFAESVQPGRTAGKAINPRVTLSAV